MASSTTIDVDDFGSDIKEAGMESLDFQDIPHDSPESPERGGQTTHFTQFPHSAADSDDEADDKDKLLKEEKTGSSSFWTFAYYQQFFDVETSQVGRRILSSMYPKPGTNYLVHQIRPNPDLYGPFWICTTLVFTTAIAGNLANYFSMAGKSYHWQYDFHKVTLAASAIFSYWWLIPLLLWGVLKWRGSQARFSFLEMLCVYGYSLAIYVPISILWAIQVAWLQWALVCIGAALSGSVLLLTFWPAIKEDSQKIAIGLMVFIFIMHAALAAGFVLYFFYVPASSTAPSPTSAAPVTLAPQPPNPLTTNKTAVAVAKKPPSSQVNNAAGPPRQKKVAAGTPPISKSAAATPTVKTFSYGNNPGALPSNSQSSLSAPAVQQQQADTVGNAAYMAPRQASAVAQNKVPQQESYAALLTQYPQQGQADGYINGRYPPPAVLQPNNFLPFGPFQQVAGPAQQGNTNLGTNTNLSRGTQQAQVPSYQGRQQKKVARKRSSSQRKIYTRASRKA